MKTIFFALLACLSLIKAQTCGSNSLNVATFNTLQIAFAPSQDDRLDATTDFFAGRQEDLQVLCLQELWDAEDRSEVIADLRRQYPYSYNAPRFAQSECSGGCRSNEIDSIKDCVNVLKCIDFTDDERFDDCVERNCRDQLESLSASCATCLLQDDDLFDSFRNIDNCLSNDQGTNQTCYAFDGQSDNLILSKIPFVATDFMRFTESPITYTTALYAQLDAPNVGRVDFFCTHLLPADLPLLTTEEGTNLNQINELLAWVDTKSNGTTNTVTVLAGDFNHGPGIWAANHDAIINAGYSSSYITAGNRNCTYCESNPLSSGGLTAIIDHIYVRNAQVSNSRRFATFEEYTANDDGVRVTLSDHYGVRTTLCPGTTQAGVLAADVTVVDNDVIPEDDNSALSFAPIVAVVVIALLM